ncbi:MAG: hypothetical protein R2867_01075 [Caldilineaceae bacterium]
MSMQQARVFVHTNRGEVKRFAKFATVGAAGAVTHFTIFNVLLQILRFSTYISIVWILGGGYSELSPQSSGLFLKNGDKPPVHNFTIYACQCAWTLINMGVLAAVRYALTPFWQQLLTATYRWQLW